MNTAALKTFAPLVRRQLIEAVAQKLDFVLSAKTPDYLTTFARQVAALRELAQSDRAGLIERVAYTWFNRIAALRYLDARGWHPFRARVLTAASSDETQPEILKLARTSALPEELRSHTNPARLNDLLDGRIPSPDPQGEVYRHLVLAACHFYHALLPDLFERLDDETELLLPDDLLTEKSVAQGFRTEITDGDCAEVEVLGWLYQFYISEKKDAVMGRKAAVPTEDIPAVTQLFTPHWIVRYLVENSLGRLWLLNRPASHLGEHMPYYIEDEPETDFLRISKPEEIRVLDPAVGSGHMLTYAFDLLCAIYEEEGYAPFDIPGLILTHNLHGVDICPRAAQLASLALVLKARDKSRRSFQADKLVRPRVLCMETVRFGEDELREYVEALHLEDLFTRPVMELLHQFEEATTFGSLIQPCLDENGIAFVRAAIEAKDVSAQLFLTETHVKVLRVIEQAEYLTKRYHVVVANPPYMGIKQMNAKIKGFASSLFPNSKADLFAMFMERGFQLVSAGGWSAMVTMQSWMFLSSYESLRLKLLASQTLHALVHMDNMVMGIAFGTAAAIWENRHHPGYRGHFSFVAYSDLTAGNQPRQFPVINERLNRAGAEDFIKIPGSPIAYWVSATLRASFDDCVLFDEIATPRQGLGTTNNEKFVRYWSEVSFRNITFNASDRVAAKASGRKWFPYNKGGEFRRWYGNQESVINWLNDGAEIKDYIKPLLSKLAG